MSVARAPGEAPSVPMSGVLTIGSALDRACRWYGPNTALVEGPRAITYADFGERIRRIAGAYWKLGVRPGDRVAFLCSGTIDHAVAYYAAHRIGGITVNFHLRESGQHQIQVAKRLEPKLLICDADWVAAAAQLIEAVPSMKLVAIGKQGAGIAATLEELLASPDDEIEARVRDQDPAIIQLSSGSTGIPKALVHSHQSVLESWTGGLYMWSGIGTEDRYLNAFSPSFVVWLVHVGSFLNHGATVVLQPRWDAQEFLKSVQNLRVTCSALTSTQWRGTLTAQPERYDLTSLRMAAYLGEKLETSKLKELTERLCSSFNSFYGMSECLGIGGCVIRASDLTERNKWGSVGKPSINSDLRIADVGARLVKQKPPGEMGEVVVRAASFATMNWGDPGWTDRVLTADGWYRTGDLGYIDEDGFVFLAGRADNQIATGGIKVTPEEIEHVIGSHPDISGVGILGVEDEKWGQRLVALVVAKDKSADASKLDAWCRADGRLAGFKCPKEWIFVDTLPQTSVGKLDRNALRLCLSEKMSKRG